MKPIYSPASFAEPSLGCLKAIISTYEPTVLIVSIGCEFYVIEDTQEHIKVRKKAEFDAKYVVFRFSITKRIYV